ncbi:MAG: amidohydrolase family protein [Desulfobulbaceae bacterium]|uniref:Amidohydrolase family protein n=1 Tax=Candidatus Desulfobia pelagia TaxID=2841692 RepID=A0A8J6NCJ9_9BACT|nr:amidohydrolase family protein [Candidatus Desulfobia pelagia]
MQLYRAPWVIPVATPPIQDGAVLVQNGNILKVGTFYALKGMAPLTTDYEDSVITPALVNGHCHLELSHLARLGQEGNWDGNMAAWIKKLLALRDQLVDADVVTEAREALASLHASGTGLVCDVGNGIDSAEIGNSSSAEVCFLLELLGLSQFGEQRARESLEEAIRQGKNDGDGLDCTPHAPYSCTTGLLKMVKEDSRRRGGLFSIHVAESEDEIEFLQTATGRLRTFVEERGAWDGSFQPPGCGAVEYLENLKVLDAHTLCVHSVHISDQELSLLAQRNAKVCVCPGSNRYLGVGVAPVMKMISHGILPAIGTDSLASNPGLNLWEEMRILREDHPGIDPKTLFTMATQAGAAALGREEYGTISPGKTGRMLAVQCRADRGSDVMDLLTTMGSEAEVSWIA